MVTIRNEIATDIAAREVLLDRGFGTERHRKTSERLREGRLPAEGLAFTALDTRGRVIGTPHGAAARCAPWASTPARWRGGASATVTPASAAC